MTSLPINPNVPLGSHKPAQDVDPMRNNFANINTGLARDHVPSADDGAFYHKQVTYWDENPPLPPTDPMTPIVGNISEAFTAPGFVEPSIPQHYWQNSQCITALSAIRAFTKFIVPSATPSAGIVAIQNFNVVSIDKSVPLVVTVTFKNNTYDTVDMSPLVFLYANTNPATALRYTVMSATTIQINLPAVVVTPYEINMLVMEI